MNKSVAITAPSGNVLHPEAIEKTEALFAERGWTVLEDESLTSSNKRFAAKSDAERALLFNRATQKADLVLTARGGYGLGRILPQIDFDGIFDRQTWVAGFSDITFFNLAYLALKGGKSLQSPTASVLGRENVDPETVEDFFRVLGSPSYHVEFETSFGSKLEVEGTLWGGNLSILASSAGTPYMPGIDGGILFAEDLCEPAYKIERDLMQLYHAGILQRQKCLLLGAFTGIRQSEHDFGYALEDAVAWLSSLVNLPIVSGLPFGHTSRVCTLVVGSRVQLGIADGAADLHVLEAPDF